MTADPTGATPMNAAPMNAAPMNAAPLNANRLLAHRQSRSLAGSPAALLFGSLAVAVLPGLRSRADAMDIPASLQPARQALLEGRADTAGNLLRKAIGTGPGNGPAHLLLCRVLLSEEFAKDAAIECNAALGNGLARDSEAQDWTGRALGAQASHAGVVSGMRLAFGVRTAFETAVALAPNSEPACVDLGEFYTAAPAIVGGGSGKALALASRIERTLPAVAHRIRAMVAEKNGDLGTAEREFQAEANVAHHPGALIDLAAFYGRHGQASKAIATAEQTLAADRALDATVVEAAGVLADAGQIPPAEAALRAYLTHGERSDRAPAFRAYTQLGALLAKSGQRDAARAEYTAALNLATGYAPARKGLASL